MTGLYHPFVPLLAATRSAARMGLVRFVAV
jgi:hypothetical protein